MKHHYCLPCLLLLFALTSAQVSFGNGQEQRPRPRPPLSRPPPRGRPPLEGRPPRPFQPGSGRPPRPLGFPNRPRPQGPFQGQQGQRPIQGQEGQRPNLGQPGSGNQKPTQGQYLSSNTQSVLQHKVVKIYFWKKSFISRNNNNSDCPAALEPRASGL